MANYLIIPTALLRWNLEFSSKNSFRLKSIGNFSLLNPYHFSKAYKTEKLIANIYTVNNSAIITTTGLIIKVVGSSPNYSSLFDLIQKFLLYLRYTSNQYDLKSHIHEIITINKIQTGILNLEARVSKSIISQDWFTSMITQKYIISADKLASSNFFIPVHNQILIDAIYDFKNNEFRKAILYSAIAIESMLSDTYKSLHEVFAKSKQKSNKFRYLIIQDSVKDPIFKFLWERADFKKLLHEIPLYLLNKTLLIENEQLYNNAINYIPLEIKLPI